MKTIVNLLIVLCFVIGAWFAGIAGAATAEATKAAPAPTIESVSKERDDLKAERDALKSEVAKLNTQVVQLTAAANELVSQRDAILQNQINAAVSKAGQPPSK